LSFALLCFLLVAGTTTFRSSPFYTEKRQSLSEENPFLSIEEQTPVALETLTTVTES
jgi:hypothetical protein